MAYSDILQELEKSHLAKKQVQLKLKTAHLELKNIVRLIDRLSNQLADIERDITVNTGMLLRNAYGEDGTDPEMVVQCYSHQVTLEDVVLDTMMKKYPQILTAGDVYLSHKRLFKNTNHVGKIMLKLVDEGKLERIPTKKGMKVKLPNA